VCCHIVFLFFQLYAEIAHFLLGSKSESPSDSFSVPNDGGVYSFLNQFCPV